FGTTLLSNAWNSVNYSAADNEVTFNAAGLATILARQNRILKIALVSWEDLTASAPADSERVGFTGSNNSKGRSFHACRQGGVCLSLPIRFF
ncbi:hypothetical protein KKA49_02570, partial [Patescibacteria group bacterium]|nr:hypothetical protein [Patescibacteria group bacterium]MBU1457224.1 hypothetical protein [Patescibacteria group bacterium]